MAVATEPETELILDVADMPASDGDGRHLVSTIERVTGDGAYGSGEHFIACAAHPGRAVDLVTPLQRPDDAEVAISAFIIDVDQRTATCPAGQTASGVRTGTNHRPIMRFTFARAVCETCRLFARCVHS